MPSAFVPLSRSTTRGELDGLKVPLLTEGEDVGLFAATNMKPCGRGRQRQCLGGAAATPYRGRRGDDSAPDGAWKWVWEAEAADMALRWSWEAMPGGGIQVIAKPIGTG